MVDGIESMESCDDGLEKKDYFSGQDGCRSYHLHQPG